MDYKVHDNILCNRQDSFGFVWGTIVKILDDNYPNYDYIIKIISFSGKPVEDDHMWINKKDIIQMYDVRKQIRIDIKTGNRVQTLKGRGVVSMVDNDKVIVDLDGDHGSYMFHKDSVWKIDEDKKR